jgi:hypothetical protein
LLIVLQRTDLLISNQIRTSGKDSITAKKLAKLLDSRMLRPLMTLQSGLRYRENDLGYQKALEVESRLLFEVIKELGQKKELKILDIGCGIAGYHRLWLNQLKVKSHTLFLMDNSEFNLKSLAYGHGDSDRYYNSLKLAKNYLSQKNHLAHRIETIEVKEEYPSKLPNKIDIVVSFLSWGFHYNLQEYWEEIINRCEPDKSILVIDVREKSPSMDFLLRQVNIKIQKLDSREKYVRVLIRKSSK